MWMAIALLHTRRGLSVTSFTVHPSTVIGIIGLAALYEWARNGAPSGPGAPFRFTAGLATMFFSLNGWLHDLSDSYLFSAHMVQHLLLALVVAPLLLMGVTARDAPAGTRAARRRPDGALAHDAHARFAIFNVVVAAWHLPPLYNYALAHHPVHIVQHLMFLAASVLMWWPVLSPLPELPRLSYPGQMLYLFLMSIPMAIVSVYIAYADGDAVSALRLRAARLGHHADERPAHRRSDHVDSGRAVLLLDHLDGVLPLAAARRRRQPSRSAGRLATRLSA